MSNLKVFIVTLLFCAAIDFVGCVSPVGYKSSENTRIVLVEYMDGVVKEYDGHSLARFDHSWSIQDKDTFTVIPLANVRKASTYIKKVR